MKVILKSKIKKLGNIGDVVEVKDGYARNMLIPNDLALFYTEKNYEFFKTKKSEIEKENQENKSKAEQLKDLIISKEIIILENAGDDGKLYGSINGIKVANFINSLLKIDSVKKSNIFLKDGIKNIGQYAIVLELHPEVSFEKNIIVCRTKEEAIKIKKGELEIKKIEATPEVFEEVVVVEENQEEKKSKKKKKEETPSEESETK